MNTAQLILASAGRSSKKLIHLAFVALFLAITCSSAENTSAVGLPTFAAPVLYPDGIPSSYGSLLGMSIGDFNADGKADVIVTYADALNMLVGIGNGVLSFSYHQPNTGFNGGYLSETGDFNNDGKLDLTVITSGRESVLLADGAGHFTIFTNGDGFLLYPTAPATGDFNRDGKLDVAVILDYRAVRVCFGSGDGTFSFRTNYSIAHSGRDIRAGSLYGNGRVDLVLAPDYSSFCVLSNKGDGTFAAPLYFPWANHYSDYHPALELGDFTGDGKLDIAVLNQNSPSVTIWINGGKGVFTQAHDYSLGFTPGYLAKADFNGDGTTDLAVGQRYVYGGGSVVSLLLGNGDGSFTVMLPLVVSSNANILALKVGSFNHNALPDIACVLASGSIVLLLNQTPPTLTVMPHSTYNQISWVADYSVGFQLEQTTNLSASNWQPFPFPPVLIGGTNAVTDWRDQGQKFYRLRKP